MGDGHYYIIKGSQGTDVQQDSFNKQVHFIPKRKKKTIKSITFEIKRHLFIEKGEGSWTRVPPNHYPSHRSQSCIRLEKSRNHLGLSKEGSQPQHLATTFLYIDFTHPYCVGTDPLQNILISSIHQKKEEIDDKADSKRNTQN